MLKVCLSCSSVLLFMFHSLLRTYLDYVASLFARNGFLRSVVAAGFDMFSETIHLNLGINKGVILLRGLSVIGILGMYYIYWYSDKLRANCKYAAS